MTGKPALFAALVLFAGCGGGSNPTPEQPAPPPPAQAPVAPWSAARLESANVPDALLTAWRAADNKSRCAPIAFASLGEGAHATPRTATFSGGWGVAYDQPQLRSAFGVAGSGVNASDSTYNAWPHHRTWADGSTAGYGPEGGTGPKQLAYLRISGQGCLYNVWSNLGRRHLEHLLESIRFVRMAS